MRLGQAGIRIRITVVSCVAVGVAVILGAIVLVLTVRAALQQSLDDQVLARASAVAALLGNRSADDVVATPGPVGVQIVDPGTGQVVAAGRQLAGIPRLSTAPPGSAALGLNVSELGWEDARLAVQSAVDAMGRPLLVYAVADQEQIVDGVAAAKVGALVGVPILVCVLGVVVWIGVGRALRPVESIRAEVSDITEGELSRRVPVPRGTDAIARLARTMNEMLDRLESAAERQRRFVADVSHELNSPLASTRAELELAAAHPDHADWTQVTAELLADNDRMTRIVRDLLLLSRLHSERRLRSAAPVDVAALLRAEVKRVAVRSTVTVTIAGSHTAVVPGDADELARVVRNILENAVRYALTEVSVDIETIRTAGTVTGLRIAVADDGPGIPLEHRDRVFDRFTRLDASRSRITGGTGLGLAIAKEIVCRHHGTIKVDRSATGGALITLELPADNHLSDGP